MGRPILIIIAGIIVTFGIRQVGLMGTLGSMDQRTVEYHKTVQAKNYAYTATELAIQEMIDTGTRSGDLGPYNFGEGMATVSLSEENDTDVRLRAIGELGDMQQGVQMLLRETTTVEVPEFLTALGIVNDEFDVSFAGNALLNGNDASGNCESAPGVIIPPQEPGICDNWLSSILAGALCSLLDLLLGGGNGGILGDPIGKAVAETINYDPVLDLIANLEHKAGVNYILGDHFGNLGTPDQPGVFFVETPTQITGGEGYGIMIIRSANGVEVGGDLKIAGNFTFHGLVIIDNVPTMNFKGTPHIRGTVLVTNSNGQNGGNTTPSEIDLGGDANIQYDCTAKEYAEKAIEQLTSSTFQTLTVYEEGRIRD